MKLRIFSPPEVESFEDYVKRCARDEEPDPISNASLRHAKIIVSELFKSAARNEEPVQIVSGKLENDFYQDLVSDARKVLERSRIEIVVIDSGDDKMEGNELFHLVRNHKNGDAVVSIERDSEATHFVLVGNRRYRIEKDDGRKDAIACFNNQGVGQLLEEVFIHHRELAGG